MGRLTKLHINGIKPIRRIPSIVVYVPDTVARTGGPWVRRLGSAGAQILEPAIASRMVRMPRSGVRFSTERIEKIKKLLATTDLSLGEIAERMDCSRAAVASINAKWRIRIYGKKRNSWKVNKHFANKS
jgi:hypothetical protein